MKFERPKTEKSKRRLKTVFYFSFALLFCAGVLSLIQDCSDIGKGMKYCEAFGIETTLISWITRAATFLSLLVLCLVYVVHIFIEGIEKPKFKPTQTETHNKFKNEDASEAGPDAAKTRRPF